MTKSSTPVVENEISEMESHFRPFREKIVGYGAKLNTPYGDRPLIYADWTASGRLYDPIERRIAEEIGPYLANTHTETSTTGRLMTKAYHEAQQIIKRHVNAGPDDVIIMAGSGMTGAVNKFQRILGLRWPDKLRKIAKQDESEKPVVFVSHMEHHSNQTSWLESQVDVVCLEPTREGLIDLDYFKQMIAEYDHRPVKIAAITACSNVTGIMTDYFDIARIIHQAGGFIFVDFACSAPYVKVDMHPEDELAKLDAIYFSPHKFLGGPGSPGALIFDSKLYDSEVPDDPGGGTVLWTNPWGEHRYFESIELREDGGTPAFLQTMKAALAVRLKEEMGIDNIMKREHEIVERVFAGLDNTPGLKILASDHRDRLAVISFYFENIHFELVTKLLNDRFGVQARGGCSCAGTYGHYLLHIDSKRSHEITDQIDQGDLASKPGWVRISFHPTMSNQEVDTIIDAIMQIGEKIEDWEKDYTYDSHENCFHHTSGKEEMSEKVDGWFKEI